PKGQTHWSTRELAKEQGVHPSTVARIWQEHELKPHRQKSFKLSRDGHFVQKLLDVVGIYLNPPQHAVVLCTDEKSQIQALDRTQPGLPLKKGRCGTWTHDYVRHGTTTSFAALDVVSGKAVRRGSFASVPDLIQAILDFIAKWNAEPTPFVWTAKAEDILAKVERCRQRLEEISPGCTKPKKRLKEAA